MKDLKRTNLGTKESYEVSKSPKNQTVYPSFYVRKKLPIDKKSIGKTFEVKAKIKLVGLDQRTSEKSDDFDYTFDIINIKF